MGVEDEGGGWMACSPCGARLKGRARQSIRLSFIRSVIDSQSNKPQPDASKQVCFEVDGELREAGHAPSQLKAFLSLRLMAWASTLKDFVHLNLLSFVFKRQLCWMLNMLTQKLASKWDGMKWEPKRAVNNQLMNISEARISRL